MSTKLLMATWPLPWTELPNVASCLQKGIALLWPKLDATWAHCFLPACIVHKALLSNSNICLPNSQEVNKEGPDPTKRMWIWKSYASVRTKLSTTPCLLQTDLKGMGTTWTWRPHAQTSRLPNVHLALGWANHPNPRKKKPMASHGYRPDPAFLTFPLWSECGCRWWW